MSLTLPERLALILTAMNAAPACTSHEEARRLLDETMKRIEDAHSGVPFDPAFPRDSGRMYPPLDDAARTNDPVAGVTRFRSRAHNTYISGAGAIVIRTVRTGEILLDKPACDGTRIELP